MIDRRLRLGLLPLVATLAACSNFVEGNGVYAVRVLDASTGLPAFTSATVGFEGEVDVSGHPPSGTLHADALERRVELSGDENVLEHIKVQVDAAGTLFMTIDVDGYSSVHPPVLLAYAPGLAGIRSRGGSEVTVLDAPAAAFAVSAGERGRIVVGGGGGVAEAALQATLSGGAQLDATAYRVRSAEVALTGASTAKVWPELAVTGSAADASHVQVKGSAGCDVALALSGGSTCDPLP